MRTNKGFTLIEILVALFIFAIMGVLAAKSLQDIIRVHNHLKARDRQTMEVIMTMTLLRRDMNNAIDRPVLNADGQKSGAFLGSGNAITFTRAGILNPFDKSRQSNMMRMEYELDGDKFVRLTWSVLDAVPDTKPAKQVLLNDVSDISWQFIASNGKKASSWPMPKQNNSDAQQQDIQTQQATQIMPIAPLPKAAMMVMHLKNQGVITGVFPIPGEGVKLASQNS